MIIGIPKEIKALENRVGITPSGVKELKKHGHTVWVETGAGVGSGFSDAEYSAAGAEILATANDVWAADMVYKVKEPLPEEYGFFRDDLLLFTYLHLAAEAPLTTALVEAGTTSIAYETVQLSRSLAAPAHPDERSCRPDVGRNRRPLPQKSVRRPRHLARWCSRRVGVAW